MNKLTFKEKIFYNLVCNENRVYKYWYTRFLLAGADLERIRRVVGRIHKWHDWCFEWYHEGCKLESLANEALKKRKVESAKKWLHEAVACFHIGQHFFFIDDEIKQQSLKKIHSLYPMAIHLDDEEQPIRFEIPFRDVSIPGYLRLQNSANRPLIIQINGLDNIKEAEQHTIGQMLFRSGFNTLTFDGPGQGEMWESMKLIPDYHTSVSAIIDWIEENHSGHVDLHRIGAIGFSMGGYFAPEAAAYDQRIKCVVSNGGPADLDFLMDEKRVNPILYRGLPHITGTSTLREAVEKLGYDIGMAPSLDVPMLLQHAGKDRLIPHGKTHADKYMNWANGEKELEFYPDGEHVCANYLDEALPSAIDWLHRHLDN